MGWGDVPNIVRQLSYTKKSSAQTSINQPKKPSAKDRLANKTTKSGRYLGFLLDIVVIVL